MEIDELRKEELPNSTAVLVLGIISLVLVWCYGGGFILAIIALALSVSSNKMYKAYPGRYTQASYKNLKTGKICAIIGLSLSVMFLLFYILLVVVLGVFSAWGTSMLY